MSLYKVGMGNPVTVIGAAGEKQGGMAPVLIILGLLGVVLAIPGKKGWQRALSKGE